MPLTPVDRALIRGCLQHERGAWNTFVDRFLGLVYHVIHSTAHHRSAALTPEDVEDLAADVLLAVVHNDYAVLRQFRKESSLATYLTVVARRVTVRELLRRQTRDAAERNGKAAVKDDQPKVQSGLDTLEEVQRLLKKLPRGEREAVRLFYLEGRSYEEISTALHLPVNSIGPILSRAKKKLRGAAREGA